MGEIVRRGLTWYGILHKRLFKKISFLLILLLIPVLSVLITLSAQEDSAFLRIAVSAQDTEQAVYQDILARLQSNSEIITVTAYGDAEQATAAVAAARADAAWIFEEDLAEKLGAVAEGRTRPFVRIVATESSTFESTTREKLFGAVFPEIAYRIYADFAAETLEPYGLPTEEELQVVYNTVFRDEEVIQFEFLDSANDTLEDARLLTAPLRGLLATVMVFCGMAATMYFIRDEKEGIFSSLLLSKRVLVLFGNNLAALSIAAVFVTAALALAGLYTSVLYETLTMLGLVLMTAGFCALLGTVCRSNAMMGAALPVVLIACIAFSPVFYNVRTFAGPQVLIPPFYYLYGVNDLRYLLPMGLYCVAVYAVTYGLYILTHRTPQI